MCHQCRQQEFELLPEFESINNNEYSQELYPEMEFELLPEVTNTPGTGQARIVDPKKVSCANTNRSYPIFKAIGTTDPVGVLESICQRAVAMMTNTITELTRIRGRIIAGDPIGSPLLSDQLAWSLQNRMLMKVEDRAAWTGKGTRNAGLIIRWLTRIRDLIASGDLWFTCLDSNGCNPTTWAWVFAASATGVNHHRIHLCRRFWQPKKGVSAATHFEYQAQTIIHEVSHIYYDTEDRGMGPGAAECISQFIAEANNSPIDPDFATRCGSSGLKLKKEMEYELMPEFETIGGGGFGGILKGAVDIIVIQQAIKAGNRDENYISDQVFYKRHPERNGKRIDRNEANFNSLRDEWLNIRDSLVRPQLLQRLPVGTGGIFRSLNPDIRFVQNAIQAGNRDETSVTNLLFYNKHPERNGKRLDPNESNFNFLRGECLRLRDNIVRPELSR
jgi:hypothetical protein